MPIRNLKNSIELTLIVMTLLF